MSERLRGRVPIRDADRKKIITPNSEDCRFGCLGWAILATIIFLAWIVLAH